MKKIYVKVVAGDWNHSSRDRREMRVAQDLGFDTVVIATTKKNKSVSEEIVAGFRVIRIPTRILGSGFLLSSIGRILAVFSFVHQIKKLKADCISGHNYSGWMLGYLAAGKKPRYIYDSHEFELYQKKRNYISFCIVKTIERFIVHNSDINMVVSNSIAREVKKLYRLKKMPLVVRNIPEKSDALFPNRIKCREEFLSNLNISKDAFIMMYHGGFAPGRGIEEAIRALAKLKNVGLVLLGYALDWKYYMSMEVLAKELGCADRMYYKKAVPFEELYDNVSAADIGLVLIQNTCLNFYYSLPNKVMENIQAQTPIIGSDFPEIDGIIQKYGIGISINPQDVNALIESIIKLQKDKDRYMLYKENLTRAKEELCWEKESIILKNAINCLYD